MFHKLLSQAGLLRMTGLRRTFGDVFTVASDVNFQHRSITCKFRDQLRYDLTRSEKRSFPRFTRMTIKVHDLHCARYKILA